MTWILVMTSVIRNRSDFVAKTETLPPVGWKSNCNAAADSKGHLRVSTRTRTHTHKRGERTKNMDKSDKWFLFHIKHIQWQCDSILSSLKSLHHWRAQYDFAAACKCIVNTRVVEV